MISRRIWLAAALIVAASSFPREGKGQVVVAADGSGRFSTVQSALDATRNADTVTILLRKGTYREKVTIARSHVTIIGEEEESTRIVFGVLREEWYREHGGNDRESGVLSIDSGVTNVTLANLTVYNDYGALHGTRNHQFAIRGAGTRIILIGCSVISEGGDALSLWDRDDGMYYHACCRFEGWVDYVCPRGWCYITDSRFFGHNTPSASIWHDGSGDRDQKFVIRASRFDGVPGFPLGRNHLDGAVYLIECSFSANMADRPFYRPPSSPRPWAWGDRHFFWGCHRDSADFGWFSDNLSSAEGSPSPGDIDARWTFGGRWDPERAMPPLLPYPVLPSPRDRARGVDTSGTVLAWVPARGERSHGIWFGKTNPPRFVHRLGEPRWATGPLESRTTYYWRADSAGSGRVWQFTTQ